MSDDFDHDENSPLQPHLEHDLDSFILVDKNRVPPAVSSPALHRTSSNDSIFYNEHLSSVLNVNGAEFDGTFHNAVFNVVYSRPYLAFFMILFILQLACLVYSLIFYTPFLYPLEAAYNEPLWLIIIDISLIGLTSVEVLLRIFAHGGMTRFFANKDTRCYNILDVIVSAVSIVSVAIYFLKPKMLYLSAALMLVRNLIRLVRLLSFIWKHYTTKKVIVSTEDDLIDVMEVHRDTIHHNRPISENTHTPHSTHCETDNSFAILRKTMNAQKYLPKEHVVVSHDLEQYNDFVVTHNAENSSLQDFDSHVASHHSNISSVTPRSYGSVHLYANTSGAFHPSSHHSNSTISHQQPPPVQGTLNDFYDVDDDDDNNLCFDQTSEHHNFPDSQNNHTATFHGIGSYGNSQLEFHKMLQQTPIYHQVQLSSDNNVGFSGAF